jgi:hypothetical protein
MGEDKEAQQVALKTQREPVKVCVGCGEGISAAENIYAYAVYHIHGLAYCLFDKICVSALRDAPIILPSHGHGLHHGGGYYAVTESGLTGSIVSTRTDFLILVRETVSASSVTNLKDSIEGIHIFY